MAAWPPLPLPYLVGLAAGAATKAGSLVTAGPSGVPPSGLRGFEIVDTAPTATALVRPAGTVVHLRSGLSAWINVNGTGAGWAPLTGLEPILFAYAAGWRPGVVVFDEAVNDVAVMVAGLSSNFRYRVILRSLPNANAEFVRVQPSGSDAGCSAYVWQDNGGAQANHAWLSLASHQVAGAGATSRVSHGVLERRVDGQSHWHATSGTSAGGGAGENVHAEGATSTDFTSLTIYLGAAARVARVIVIEEWP